MYMAAGIALVFILPTVFLIRDGNKGGFEDESDDEASISSADQETAATTANRFEKVDLAEPGAAYSADSKNRSSFLPPAINTNVAGPTTEAAAVATNVVKQSSFASRCMMLLLKPRFIILCLSCLCTNIIREILCHYSLGYFQKVLKLPSSLVGSVTALFSAFSALSSFFGGRLMDSVPRRHRGIVNTLYSSGLVAFISAVYMCMEMDPIKPGDDLESKRVRLIALMTVAEFFLGPPVSFLDGLFVIDLVEHERKWRVLSWAAA